MRLSLYREHHHRNHHHQHKIQLNPEETKAVWLNYQHGWEILIVTETYWRNQGGLDGGVTPG